MATYPNATLRLLGAQTQPQMSRHDIVCVHTMVGYLTSTDGYFRNGNGAGFDGTESHFGIGGKWGPDLGGGMDGRVYQWQDTEYTADANLQGNPRVLSIETADNAPARPEDIEAWTLAQVDSLVPLIVWLCQRYDIPPVLIPDTQSFRRGLAYHAQGAAEHTVGEWWSTSPTKPCPAARRIAQYKAVVIPRVQVALAPPIPGGFMAGLNETEQRTLFNNVDHLNRMFSENNTVGDVNSLMEWRSTVDAALADIKGKLDKLLTP